MVGVAGQRWLISKLDYYAWCMEEVAGVTITSDVAQIHALFVPAGTEQK
jgi:hypothetical protein